MEEHSQLINLVSGLIEGCKAGSHKLSEEKKLELRLGPPGDRFFSHKTMAISHGAKRVLEETTGSRKGEDNNWFGITNENQCKKFSTVVEKGFFSPLFNGSSQCPTSYNRESQKELKHSRPSNGLPCSDKRAIRAPAVGWPPIRSFRKNLARSSSASKLASKSTEKEGSSIKPETGSSRNDLFVKINVEGVPIGRKINLNAYDSYEKLSVAIDQLFSGLIAAQSKTTAAWTEDTKNVRITHGGSVSGSGEYTLIYEDDEGDRMLVGDVPWTMFVRTVRRLRVLKGLEPFNPRREFTS